MSHAAFQRSDLIGISELVTGMLSSRTWVHWSIGILSAARRMNADGYVARIVAFVAAVNGPFVKMVILGEFNETALSALEMISLSRVDRLG